MIRVSSFIAAAAVPLCFSMARATPPKDVTSSKEDVARILFSQAAPAAAAALSAEEDALAFQLRALGQISESGAKYLVKTGGVYRPISEEEADRLASFVAMRVFLRDRDIPDWPGLDGESQLREALTEAETVALAEIDPLPAFGLISHNAVANAGLRAGKLLRAALDRMTDRNYAEIEARGRQLEAWIAEIAAVKKELRQLKDEPWCDRIVDPRAGRKKEDVKCFEYKPLLLPH